MQLGQIQRTSQSKKQSPSHCQPTTQCNLCLGLDLHLPFEIIVGCDAAILRESCSTFSKDQIVCAQGGAVQRGQHTHTQAQLCKLVFPALCRKSGKKNFSYSDTLLFFGLYCYYYLIEHESRDSMWLSSHYKASKNKINQLSLTNNAVTDATLHTNGAPTAAVSNNKCLTL